MCIYKDTLVNLLETKMERTHLSRSVFSAVIFLFAFVTAISQDARALPVAPSIVSRSSSDDYTMGDDATSDCFVLVIEGTDCEVNDMSPDDIAEFSDVFVEIIINDNLEYNSSLAKYCEPDPSDRSGRSASLQTGSFSQNNCPDIPYVLESPRGCGFSASHIAGERFTVRFYDPDPDSDSEELLCSSNISEEAIYNITKSRHRLLYRY